MLKLSSILRVFLLLLCFAGTVSLAALGGSEESIPPSSNSDERTDENFRKEREVMLEKHLRRRGISDPPVLEAMERVPRQDFVVDRYRIQAYADKPLPIGYGQTISQPY
ncbi:MAG TPA: hypothetical protein ENN41_04855, partial [Sediminispirochaeta sp.]|nr:hypothetical protein [Sediminispirochaeta sp.]